MSSTLSTPSSTNETAPTWIATNFLLAWAGAVGGNFVSVTDDGWLLRLTTEADVTPFRNSRRDEFTYFCDFCIAYFLPCVYRLKESEPKTIPIRAKQHWYKWICHRVTESRRRERESNRGASFLNISSVSLCLCGNDCVPKL